MAIDIAPASQRCPWSRSQKKQTLALRNPRDDDLVAGLQVVDALADLLHDTRALVPEHDRRRDGDRPVLDRQVGVAHAGGAEAHPHLAHVRGVELEVDHLEGCVDCGTDGGSGHACALPRV